MGFGLRRQAKCGGIKNGREWGFKEEVCRGETIGGKGNAVFCPCFSFLFPLVVSPLHSVRTL